MVMTIQVTAGGTLKGSGLFRVDVSQNKPRLLEGLPISRKSTNRSKVLYIRDHLQKSHLGSAHCKFLLTDRVPICIDIPQLMLMLILCRMVRAWSALFALLGRVWLLSNTWMLLIEMVKAYSIPVAIILAW